MMTVDLNCDMGETPGNQPGSDDEQILPYVTSANIACGFHAGDALRMHLTVQAALRHGVAIGAHPGLPDLDGFGRREQFISPEEAYQITLYQIGALHGFVRAAGGTLHHVKPHGALYNMAARDIKLAEAIVAAVYDFDPSLTIYALAGSKMVQAARNRGLSVAAEGFIDRTYQPDGTLTPRTQSNALLTSIQQIVNQSVILSNQMDTLCIHGDAPHAIEVAKAVHHALTTAGIQLQAPSQ